ncbi:helix-turn-helix transcriptional regulator [Novosphingobium olei]|uniref:helix-turn-helix domain-containing protein n=1 Tax=Novosphingobium olei TaxID=2728851 RepID=UPI0030CFC3E3
MVRKRLPTTSVGPDWFLVEWMQSKNMKQAELARRTGWSKATTNDIVNGRTSYYRQILNEAAAALHVQPWELLMSPADANALRGMREDAIRIAGGTVTAWTPASLEDERKTGTG